MSECANCNNIFKKKPGNAGFYRFSLEKPLASSGILARSELESITGQPVTPVSKLLQGKFLCSSCWSLLNTSAKYRQSCKDFLGKTATPSYIGQKRLRTRTETESISSPRTSFKRPRFTSTPLQHKVKAARAIFSKGGTQNVSKWDTIITAIRARQYRRAIKGIYQATKASKRHFVSVAVEIVTKEVQALISKRSSFPLAKDIDIPSIQDFSWDETLAHANESAPLLLGVLKGAVTTKQNEESLIRGNKVQLRPKVGTSLALLLHAKAPQTFHFLPTLISVQFWRGNLKRESIKQLSHLGLCLGPNATLSAIDKIRHGFDEAAVRLKNSVEQHLRSISTAPAEGYAAPMEPHADLSMALSTSVPNIEDEVVVLSDSEVDSMSKDDSDSFTSSGLSEEVDDSSKSEDSDTSSGESKEGSDNDLPMLSDRELSDSNGNDHAESDGDGTAEMTENVPYGFTFCWDNVGKKVVTRRPTVNVKNTYINMALGYIAINRVQSAHFLTPAEDLIKAATIPVTTFVPSDTEFKELASRMSVIIGRMLTRHFKWYKDHFSQFSVSHIVHEHTIESTLKSVLINLGVFKQDPSSTQGAIEIYSKLQEYVPVLDGKPVTTVVYGDGLSCERGNDAQCARANGLNPVERLEGLEPAAQEFHKEMILLQDFYDDFYSAKSAADRGTLCQVRNMFNFRQVKPDTSDNFSHAWELMCLMTETCLFVSDGAARHG